MTTTAILIRDMKLGLAGEFCEVFISSKTDQPAPPKELQTKQRSAQYA